MLFPSLSLAIAMHQAAPDGRYEGVVHFSSFEQPFVLDVDHKGAGGAARGSAVLPGLNVHGAPLGKLQEDSGKFSFELPDLGGITVSGNFEGEHFRGTFRQSGNAGDFDLKRIGNPQVNAQPPQPAAAFSPNLVGTWSGDFVFLYKRHLTVQIANSAGHGTATFVVKGKRTTTLKADVIEGSANFLQLKDSTTGVTIEAHPNGKSATMNAVITIGGIESKLVLTREKGAQ